MSTIYQAQLKFKSVNPYPFSACNGSRFFFVLPQLYTLMALFKDSYLTLGNESKLIMVTFAKSAMKIIKQISTLSQ